MPGNEAVAKEGFHRRAGTPKPRDSQDHQQGRHPQRPQGHSGPPAGPELTDPRDTQDHQQGWHPDPRDTQDHQQGWHPDPRDSQDHQQGRHPETPGTVRTTSRASTQTPGTVRTTSRAGTQTPGTLRTTSRARSPRVPRDSQDHQQGQHPGAPEIGPPAGPAPTLQGQSGPPAGPAPPETLGTVRNTGSCWTPLPQGTVTSNRGICGSQWEVTFNAYIWNPEKLVLMNVFARKEWRHRCREWTVDAAGEGPRATEGEGGIDIRTPSESGGQLRKPPCSPGSLV